MSAPEYESVGWVVMYDDGSHTRCVSEQSARDMAERDSGNFVCEPIQLFRLRKPVPKRPRRCIADRECEIRNGRLVQTALSCTLEVTEAAHILAAAELIAATAAWEAEFGGGVS